MKPESSLLRCIAIRSWMAVVALTVAAVATEASAGYPIGKAPTLGVATDLSISSDVVTAEPCLVVATVAATSLNGPIATLTADLTGLPAGYHATFVTDAMNTTGTLIWHPAPGDRSGLVAFTATTTNGQTATSIESITVPDPIQALATFHWAPTLADLGSYPVSFDATGSGGEMASLVMTLTVINRPMASTSPTRSTQRLSPEAPTRGPIVSIFHCGECGGGSGGAIDTVNVGSTPPGSFDFPLAVFDPDDEPIVAFTVETSGLPIGNTATFDVQLGDWAKTGGPYSGVVGVPVAFDGSASRGSPFTWDFGDSKIGDGVVTSHTYTTPGTYQVTLVVGARGPSGRETLADCDVTSVVIGGGLPARAFVADRHRTTPDSQSGQPLCIQIEPVNGAYDNLQVDLSTIRMYSNVPGSTANVTALSDKTMVAGDRDRNGIQEITACFGREALQSFLDGTQGRQTVPVTIVADLMTGGTLMATLDLNRVRTGNSLAGSVHPNPLRQAGTVSFETAKSGPIKVLLFDLHGRLVRTLLDQPHATGGRHEIPIDGRDSRGRRLASGIYLYRVQATEGVATGRVILLE